LKAIGNYYKHQTEIFEFEEAKEFARKVFAGNHIELSGFKQAQIGNGEWDNV
jgi:hypothetical protein